MRRSWFAAAILLTLPGLTRAQELVYAITVGEALVSFQSTSSHIQNNIGAVSGLIGGHIVRDMDYRIANGQIYVLSTNNPNTQGQLYTLNTSTAVLTPVGTGFTLTGNSGPRYGIDFNPVTSQLHVITSDGLSYRVNADTGALIAQDANISYVNGTAVTAIAFNNNVVGATSTTLYAYEFNSEEVTTVNTTTGVMTFAGTINPLSASIGINELDISGSGNAYFAMDSTSSPTNNYEFYQMDLTSGQLTQLGSNEMPNEIIGFTVVPEPATTLFAAGGLLALGAVARRRKSK